MNSKPATRSPGNRELPGRLLSHDGQRVCDVRYSMEGIDESRGRLRPRLGDLLPPIGTNLTLALTDGRLLRIVVTSSKGPEYGAGHDEHVAGFIVLRITH